MLIKGRAIDKKDRKTKKALLLNTKGMRVKGWRIESICRDKPALVVPIIVKGSGSIVFNNESDIKVDEVEILFTKFCQGHHRQFLLSFTNQYNSDYYLLWEKVNRCHKS